MSINSVSFSSPSNIAFVKYWGKYGRQLPMNPSISMTLSECKTMCQIDYEFKKGAGKINTFLFEGNPNSSFQSKIEKFLSSIRDIYPLGDDLVLNISTSNTFPHSAGIASSASAMSALCMCLVQIEKEVLKYESFDLERASYLSRLASGSAARSLFPSYALWGDDDKLGSVDGHANPFLDFHQNFASVCDSVLIVSKKEKEVSSSAGHKLMEDHPFRDARVKQAKDNFHGITQAMRTGDWHKFGEILENEALTLHALMMSSTPSFILLNPGSLSLIEKIKEYRIHTKHPVYFTIDAGPNIHLIYPSSIEGDVKAFIENTLKHYCEDGLVIHDRIGLGACKEQ